MITFPLGACNALKRTIRSDPFATYRCSPCQFSNVSQLHAPIRPNSSSPINDGFAAAEREAEGANAGTGSAGTVAFAAGNGTVERVGEGDADGVAVGKGNADAVAVGRGDADGVAVGEGEA